MGLSSRREDTKVEAMKALATTILTCTVDSTKSITNGWTSVTNEDSMSIYVHYDIKLEMLCFYLHMMDRYALSIGGPEARAALQDAVVVPTIQAMVNMSFNTSNAKKGFDSQKWKNQMASEALDEYNKAGVDYFSCKNFGTEDKSAIFHDGTVIGKLAKRIENIAGQGLNLNLRMLVLVSMTDSLVKFKLKKQVEKACSTL